MSLTPEEIQKMLDVVRATQTEEIDCDVCLYHLGEFAELHLVGKPVPEGLSAVEQHLAICGECREEFEALCQAMRSFNSRET